MDRNVTVYVNDEDADCRRLVEQLDDWEVNYDTKNVTADPKNLEQLQEHGIFATPATFIDENIVLGFQKDKLKHTLGLD